MLKFIAIGFSVIARTALTLNAKQLILWNIGSRIGNLILPIWELNILYTYEIVGKLIFLIAILPSSYMSIAQSFHECKVLNVYFFGEHLMHIIISTRHCDLIRKCLILVLLCHIWDYGLTSVIVTVQLIDLLLSQRVLNLLLAEDARIIKLVVLEWIIICIWFLILV